MNAMLLKEVEHACYCLPRSDKAPRVLSVWAMPVSDSPVKFKIERYDERAGHELPDAEDEGLVSKDGDMVK